MLIVLATLVALHGLAHMVGFAAPFGYLKNPPPTPLPEHLGLGAGAMKAVGIAWFIAMLVFVATAILMVRRDARWPAAMIAACALSILLTALFLPYAKIGLIVDVALIAFVIANRSYEWIPSA